MAAIGYVVGDRRGAVDRLLAQVVTDLQARGLDLAGVVQVNTETAQATRCDMDLRVLGRGDSVRISQRLGNAASGCRLDPGGLATAVGLVEGTLEGKALLVVNKFGKAELEGGGFRPLIGQALLRGIPVLAGVKRDNLAGFLDFAGGMAEPIAADRDSVIAWCVAQAAGHAGTAASR